MAGTGPAAAGSGTTAAHLASCPGGGGAMKGAMILLHGRGASAEDILGLREEFGFRDVTYFAPEATGRAWYPYSFLAPIEQNEPWLSKSLAKVGETVDAALRQGIAREK